MTDAGSVVVAGHICLDVIPDMSGNRQGGLDEMFLPGSLLEVGPVSFSSGGAVSNTGLVLHKLGIRTHLMGKIGNDLFGQAVRKLVSSVALFLADGIIVAEEASTSYSVIISPPGVDRIFLHCPGANDTFSSADVQYDILSEAHLFHFGYPPLMRRLFETDGAELVKLLRLAKETGVTTSLDMALPDPESPSGQADWPSILRSALLFVDIFLPSIEEVLYMLRPETYDELRSKAGEAGFLALIAPELLSDLSRELLAMGPGIVGLKLGDRGLYLRTADQETLEGMGRGRPADVAAWADKELWAPCLEVDVVGTTGAGDAAIAGLLSALLRGLSPEAAATVAVTVGACSVETADALSGIRTWEETVARSAGGCPRRGLLLEAPGWQYDQDSCLWVGGGQGLI